MRQFVLIALTQLAATWTSMMVMAGTSGNSWYSDIARAFFIVLSAPIVLLGMLLARYLGGSISLTLISIPNALLWSAAICWWLSRRNQVTWDEISGDLHA